MVTISREVTLPAAPARVWTTAIAPESWADWLSLHLRWPDGPPPPPVQGSEFRQIASLLNIPMPVRWQVTDCAEPSLFAMTGQALAGVSVSIRFDLAEDAGQTALVLTADLSGALIAGTLQATVQKYADAQFAESIEALGRLLAATETA